MSPENAQSEPRSAGDGGFPGFLYGGLLAGVALALYLLGIAIAFTRFLFFDRGSALRDIAEFFIWYSGIPFITGLLLAAFDLAFSLPKKRIRGEYVTWDPPASNDVTVVLTAYNDEESIAEAVADFRAHPRVRRVIVVDNNSSDRTGEVAREAGAIVVTEMLPGYGRCVFRCLTEGMNAEGTELTLLCEGDCTFRAYDIDKFLAYAPHADIVNGTRISEQLRAFHTQLTTFMYYGNFFAGKLLELKHLGRGTFTDVGTTYKLCRNSALARLLPLVNAEVNLEFNAHFLDVALGAGFPMVECPVTFHNRVGTSKGGNVSNVRALQVGLRMIRGIVLGWPAKRGGA